MGLIACVMLLGLSSVFAQSKEVTGTVIDESGFGLPGVSVAIKGTTVGASTDIDGKWSLTVASKDVLEFSFVGMKTQEIKVGNKTVFNVTLAEDRVAIEEFIVTGYGVQKKSSFTGSVSSVGGDKIGSLNRANPVAALEGSSAGVQVLSGSGQPGSEPTVRIRGISSINGSKDPLYVVDGMIYDGNISNIASTDIASMNVLKDAASTALYGARGGNGVIVITTKSGKKGETKVTVRANVGFSERAIPEYERVGAKDYYEMSWEGYRNGLYDKYHTKYDFLATPELAGVYASEHLIEELLGTNKYNVADGVLIDPTTGRLNKDAKSLFNDKLEDILYRTGVKQEYGVSVSGGSENTKYYISVGTLDQKGILADSDFKRDNARLKVDSKVNDWLKVGLNLSASQGRSSNTKQSDGAASAVFSGMRNIGPIYPAWVRNADGSLLLNGAGDKIIDYGNGDDIAGQGNFIRKHNQGSSILARRYDPDQTKRNNLIANLYAEVEPLKDVKVKVVYNKSINNYNNLDHMNMVYGGGAKLGGNTYRKFYTSTSYTFQQYITWDKTIGIHHFNVAGIHENYDRKYNYMDGSRKGFPVPGVYEFKAASTTTDLASGEESYKTEAYLFKGEYDCLGKYYANASYRAEASSRFYKDNRWGGFWSLGLAWRMSEEDFMKSIDFIDNLRVKASYGTNGNDNIGGYYAYQAQYSTGKSNANQAGVRISTFENRDLTWEKQNKFNAGFELSVLNGLVNLEIDYFRTETSDLLFDRPIPRSSGLRDISTNIGTMVNAGMEYAVGFHPLKDSEFKWDLSLNLTHYKNEVTELADDFIRHGNQAYQVGKSAYEFYMYKSAGIDYNTGDYIWYKKGFIKDKEGNYILDKEGEKIAGDEWTTNANDADEYWQGTSLPDFYGGMTNTFSYKGLTLTANITYSVGGKIVDYAYSGLMSRSAEGSAWHKDILNRWTPENRDTDVARLAWESSQTGISNTDRYLVDASYLNISNIAMSYTLPNSLLSKFGIKSVALNASVSNLAFFSARKGLNSAASISGGSDSDVYSPLRTYSFGTVINF